jgi:translocation and assembly module TamA
MGGRDSERVALEARFQSFRLWPPPNQAAQGPEGRPQIPDQELPQIAVRATTDRALLERLLHVYGYYDGEVLQSTAPSPRPRWRRASRRWWLLI